MGRADKEINEIVEKVRSTLQEKHIYYYDLLIDFPEASYRQIMMAWGLIRETDELSQDEQGRYYIDARQGGTG